MRELSASGVPAAGRLGSLPGQLGAPPRVLRLFVDDQAGWFPTGGRVPDNAQSSLCRVRRGGPWCLTSLGAQRPGGLAPPREGMVCSVVPRRRPERPTLWGWSGRCCLTCLTGTDASGAVGVPGLAPGDDGVEPAQQRGGAGDAGLPGGKPVTFAGGQVGEPGAQDRVVGQC